MRKRIEAVSSDLPEEIVTQILLRLPYKSLMRFKCVSKFWYALFTNPNFISSHFKFNNINGSTLVSCVNEITGKVSLSLISHKTLENVFYPNPDLDLPQSIKDEDKNESSLVLLGPVNGVLCVFFPPPGSKIHLWNPFTREFLVLPRSNRNYWDYTKWVVGFGLDFINTNEFKIVRIKIQDYSGRTPVEIYNLGMGSWRETNCPLPCGVMSGSCNAYVNGACHWLARPRKRDEDGQRFIILCFNMGDELFRNIDGPIVSAKSSHFVGSLQLGVINESLALVTEVPCNAREKCFAVWVMKEYGDEESWTKLYTVGPFLGVDRLVGLLKNGKFILQNICGQLSWYDPHTAGTKNIQVHGVLGSVQLVSYVESSSSIKGGNVLLD